MNKSNQTKTIIMDSLENAKGNLIEEQFSYREVMDASPIEKYKTKSNFSLIHWDVFLGKLEEFYYPPDRKSLNKYLVDPNQYKIDIKNRIDNIEDIHIRPRVNFLNEIILQTQRKKVIAELYKQFGDLDDFHQVFINWLRYSQCELIIENINTRSELNHGDSSISQLELDTVSSQIMLCLLLDLEFSDEDPRILKNTPKFMLEEYKEQANKFYDEDTPLNSDILELFRPDLLS
jgi:hypothetical protein